MQDIESILAPIKVPDAVKARAWDAYHDSKDEEEFTKAFTSLPIPDEIKASLWDMKYGQTQPVSEVEAATDPNQAIKDAQKAKYPTAAEKGGKVGTATTAEDTRQHSTALQRVKNFMGGFGFPTSTEGMTAPSTPVGSMIGMMPLAFPKEAAEAAVETVTQPVVRPYEGYREMKEGESEGDANKMMHGLGKFTSGAIPLVEGAKAGTEAIGKEIKSRSKYAQERPLVFTKPEGHLQISLKPDLDDEGILVGGSEIKAGEAKIGKPVKDIDTFKEAAKAQFRDELMPTRRSIIDDQKDVTVPGSRRAIIRAKIAEIPKDIQPKTKEYNALVREAYESVPNDLTIGQLEGMSTSLNSTNRAFHQAKLSQALGKMETARGAFDVAAERAAREMMEEGMQAHGLGGWERLKEVNRRIGALIKMEDSVDVAEKTARAEAAEPRLRKALERFTSVRAMVKGNPTVNEGIANAMRKWEHSNPPIQMGPEWGPTGHARQIPSQTSNPRQLNAMPDQSGVTATPAAPGQHYYRQLPAGKGFEGDTVGKAGSPYAMGEGGPVPGTGESFAAHLPGPVGPKLSKGPFTGQPIVGEAQPLQPTVIRSGSRAGRPATPIMGVNQAKGAAIPPGSKLVFKTKTLDGQTRYHYETPEHLMMESDRELTPEFTKTKPAAPYEAGSSWAGSPYEGSSLPPPPKRKSGSRKKK